MAGTDAYYASVEMWAGTYAPRNWTYCYGQYISIADNPALYAVMSNYFGGDGVTNFALPDMRGRGPIGEGLGPGLTNRVMGQKGGQEAILLDESQMPLHTHTASFTQTDDGDISASVALPVKTGFAAGVNNPVDNYFGSSGGTNLYYTDYTSGSTMAPVPITGSASNIEGAVSIGETGGTVPFSIMQPYSVLSFIICIDGLFPPRT